MFGSEMLDIAIGLTLVYVLLSVVCSTLNEFISGQLLNRRATELYRALGQLLRDPQGDGAFMDKVLGHPLIVSQGRPGGSVARRRPDYIPARLFAMALLDVAVGDDKRVATLEELRADVAGNGALPEGVKRVLLTLMDHTQGGVEELRTRVEGWFDDAMERTSSWYKRHAQVAILLIGTLAVIALNADTLMIAETLWRDATLREMLVAQAGSATATPLPEGTDVTRAYEALRAVGLPLGWTAESPLFAPALSLAYLGTVAAKLVGLAITVFAVSLGAPFWFDLLGRLITIRTTGVRPPRADAPQQH